MNSEPIRPARGQHVLVVEEHMMPMLLAEDVLLAEGYRVATAASFQGAMGATGSAPPRFPDLTLRVRSETWRDFA